MGWDEWNALPPRPTASSPSTSPTPSWPSPVVYAVDRQDHLSSLLAAYTQPSADLQAILLTGIPSGIISGFQNFGGGAALADELRLNVAVPPSTSPNIYGLLGKDLAGFPNGRRVQDDVVAIELRAIAGARWSIVVHARFAASLVTTDGTTPT
jgi:hypothetical protein